MRTTAAYDVVDSTSDRAAELVRAGECSLPLLVFARRQTQGRGRGSNEWWSDAGSLTFTVGIDPAQHGMSVENEPKLALATAVAVIEALDELSLGDPSIGIRWPNDLEANGRKIGGILPERIDTEHGPRVLIGIGLNVKTNLTAAPAEVRMMATSLAELHARPLELETSSQLLGAILSRFESVLERLAVGDPSLPDRWNRLDLLRDQWVRIELGTRQLAGRGQGIDARGALCLDDGRQRTQIFGGRVVRDEPGAASIQPNKQS